MESMLYAMGNPAQATGAPQSAGGPMAMVGTLFPLILMVVVFYFLLWRPQQKQAKARKQMLEALKVGDDVVTAAGFYGTITKIDEDKLVVRIAEGVNVKLARHAVEGLAKQAEAK